MERSKDIKKVLFQILFLNIAVSIAKASWGLISGSTAMFADGLHSLSDGSSNIIALVAMKVAGQPLDDEHPYGHEKYESFASAVIGIMLCIAAWRVGSSSVSALAAYVKEGTLPPVEVTSISFAIMLITLAINIFVVWYERRRGVDLESDVLQSDARHTLSDIWVTLGVILSLVLVKLGVALADPIVGLFVALAILYAAFEVFKSVNATFSDQARLDPVKVRDTVLAFKGIKGCHNIRTRGTGAMIHMDLSILVNPKITIDKGHAIATDLEEELCRRFTGLKDVVVHIEPDNEIQRSKPFLAAKY